MPRRPRLVFEGMPHHVVQRGNYRQAIFECREDFQRYSYWVMEYAQKYSVEIISYCLMTNHVHFIVVPTSKESLSLFFNTVHMRYSQYKHKKNGRSGHLWQGRFYSAVLDDAHLLRGIRYVELNPVRAKIVEEASDYAWSSARFHLGLEKDPIIKTYSREMILRLCGHLSWNQYLKGEDGSMVDLMREKTRKGQIIATEENISSIERKFGIILQSKSAGRPKKEK